MFQQKKRKKQTVWWGEHCFTPYFFFLFSEKNPHPQISLFNILLDFTGLFYAKYVLVLFLLCRKWLLFV